MVTKALILAALLRLPAWSGDSESEPEREVRLEVVAESIHSAASSVPWRGDRNELVALLVMTGWKETKYARHIHEGKCRIKKGECDGGRAASPWQLQHGSWFPKKTWEKTKGTDLESTTRASTQAAKILSRGRNYCGDVMGSISLYATGRTCSWMNAPSRFRLWRRVLKSFRV